ELVCSGIVPQGSEIGSSVPTIHEQLEKLAVNVRRGRQRETTSMVLNVRTASFRQLAARWSTATGVLMSVSSIRRRLLHRGLHARVPLYRISLTKSHRWLSL
ncbi:hypothetical protein TNCV_1078871, partial [Trichonephila clavipes]